MKYLLDVNCLLACIWSDHVHHPQASKWIAGKELAVCPLAQLGFLRISTNPKVRTATMADARTALGDFLTKNGVEFVAADMPALSSSPAKSEQVTDHYLADLAVSKGCKLATFDTRLKHKAAQVIS